MERIGRQLYILVIGNPFQFLQQDSTKLQLVTIVQFGHRILLEWSGIQLLQVVIGVQFQFQHQDSTKPRVKMDLFGHQLIMEKIGYQLVILAIGRQFQFQPQDSTKLQLIGVVKFGHLEHRWV